MSSRPAVAGASLKARRETVAGIAVNLLDSGPASGDDAVDETLVFIHGITATLSYWRANLAHFAARRRVIAIDLPGFGGSDRPDIAYDMDHMVEIVRELLDSRGLYAATLVGNSMGGLIAMRFALLHPTRVHRLVLVDPAGLSLWPRRLMLWGMALAHVGSRALTASLGGSALKPAGLPRVPPVFVTALFRAVFPGKSEIAQRYTERYVNAISSDEYPLHVRASWRAARSIVSLPMRQRCAEIAAPTLIVWGARDRLVPVRDGKLLRERIAGSRLLIYSKSGHCPMVDQPERFNRDVERFLDGKPVGR